MSLASLTILDCGTKDYISMAIFIGLWIINFYLLIWTMRNFNCFCFLLFLLVKNHSDWKQLFGVMTKEHKMKKYWYKELEIAKTTLENMNTIRVIDGSNDQQQQTQILPI